MYGQDIIREDGSALSVEKEPKYIIVKNVLSIYRWPNMAILAGMI